MKQLDEARIGLLIRMSCISGCVCLKKIQEPLVKRGYSKQVRPGTYELTRDGKKAAAQFIEEYKDKPPLRTWGGICIGPHVMIVQHKVKP